MSASARQTNCKPPHARLPGSGGGERGGTEGRGGGKCGDRRGGGTRAPGRPGGPPPGRASGTLATRAARRWNRDAARCRRVSRAAQRRPAGRRTVAEASLERQRLCGRVDGRIRVHLEVGRLPAKLEHLVALLVARASKDVHMRFRAKHDERVEHQRRLGRAPHRARRTLAGRAAGPARDALLAPRRRCRPFLGQRCAPLRAQSKRSAARARHWASAARRKSARAATARAAPTWLFPPSARPRRHDSRPRFGPPLLAPWPVDPRVAPRETLRWYGGHARSQIDASRRSLNAPRGREAGARGRRPRRV